MPRCARNRSALSLADRCCADFLKRLIDILGKAKDKVKDICKDDPEPQDRCKQVRQQCIEECSDTTLPTPDGLGWEFVNCVNDCMILNGCLPGTQY